MAVLKKGQNIGVCVHHSVYPQAKTLAELKIQAKLFNGWHKKKSWAEDTKAVGNYPYISYHYLMALDGSILQVTDEKYVKYHAGDNYKGKDSFNLHGIGMCITGNYKTDKPNDQQEKALVLFIRDVEKRQDINANVRGHKEVAHSSIPTACPGKNIGTSKVGWLKKVIANTNDKNYPPVAPPVDPEIIKLQKQILDLEEEIEGLRDELKNCKGVAVRLNDQLEDLQKKYDTLKVEKDKIEKQRNECVRKLNSYMETVSTRELVAELFKRIFSKRS